MGAMVSEEDEKKEREIRYAKVHVDMITCDTCHIPYPRPLMKQIEPTKLCKSCDIQRHLRTL